MKKEITINGEKCKVELDDNKDKEKEDNTELDKDLEYYERKNIIDRKFDKFIQENLEQYEKCIEDFMKTYFSCVIEDEGLSVDRVKEMFINGEIEIIEDQVMKEDMTVETKIYFKRNKDKNEL